MTPSDLAKSKSEHSHQSALFCFMAMAEKHGFAAAYDEKCYKQVGYAQSFYGAHNAIPELKWLHAIANGGARGDNEKSRQIRGGQLKAEGVKKGVYDVSLPVKRGEYSGLYMELKKEGGRTSKEQQEFGQFVSEQGFASCVCEGWQNAAEQIKLYIEYMQN